MADGADFLDVGGVKAGPGPEVDEQEELERVVPGDRGAARALRRADLGRHVAAVGRSTPAFAAGAVVGNDISGFADPDYLPARAAAGASVVATHIRLGAPGPRSRARTTTTWSPTVCDFLADRAARAEAAGIPRERIMVDAGLDLGKTEPQSLELLRDLRRLAGLGYPVFLSASNKRFLGDLLGTDVDDRREASHGRPRARHRARAAGSCGPTTSGAPGGSPT